MVSKDSQVVSGYLLLASVTLSLQWFNSTMNFIALLLSRVSYW